MFDRNKYGMPRRFDSENISATSDTVRTNKDAILEICKL